MTIQCYSALDMSRMTEFGSWPPGSTTETMALPSYDGDGLGTTARSTGQIKGNELVVLPGHQLKSILLWASHWGLHLSRWGGGNFAEDSEFDMLGQRPNFHADLPVLEYCNCEAQDADLMSED